MKYQTLINSVDKLEEEIGSTESTYFGAIEKLGRVREDLRKLEVSYHLHRIVKPFLVEWGNISRVVKREGLDWEELAKTLRNLENEFRKLRGKKFITIDFDEEKVSNAIIVIYVRLCSIPYLGGPTTLSKILHLLNPEIFVMWDGKIRDGYKKRIIAYVRLLEDIWNF